VLGRTCREKEDEKKQNPGKEYERPTQRREIIIGGRYKKRGGSLVRRENERSVHAVCGEAVIRGKRSSLEVKRCVGKARERAKKMKKITFQKHPGK